MGGAEYKIYDASLNFSFVTKSYDLARQCEEAYILGLNNKDIVGDVR